MQKIIVLVFVIVLAFMNFGCKEAAETGRDPQILSTTISSTELMPLDASRTYHSTSSQVQPEFLLISLWRSGLRVQEGLQPLNNQCADPQGPRFTVVLAAPDSRISAFGFAQGEGRLACSTEIRRYEVRAN